MAGKITTNTVQLGDSATATQNAVLQTNVDGTFKLARGNSGATTQDVLTVDASGNVNAPVGLQQGGVATGRMVLSTAQNSTSGTSIDFTGIPSWAKKITVMFSGVSTNGTSLVQVQIGSGSVTTSGYLGGATVTGLSTLQNQNYTTGFVVGGGSGMGTTAATRHGCIQLANLTGNVWVANGIVQLSDTTNQSTISGSLALSGTLDRVRITTVGGTDTFDAGSINILYEG